MIVTYADLIRRLEAIQNDLPAAAEESRDIERLIHKLRVRQEVKARTTGKLPVPEAVEASHD